MATFPISDTFNLVVPDGIQEEVQSLIDSIETSVDSPLADVDFTELADSVLAGIGDGKLSPVELAAIAVEAIGLAESLGITDSEANTIFSNVNDLVDAAGSLETGANLTGTAGNDGLADYAAIADFNAESDTIQLRGTASDYTLTGMGDDVPHEGAVPPQPPSIPCEVKGV